jgi:hypothetical protein
MAATIGMARGSRNHRQESSDCVAPGTVTSTTIAVRRAGNMAAPPPRWLTLLATLSLAALHLSAQRGAQAQVFDWNGISIKQYVAQEHYEHWQKDDETYDSWAYRNVRTRVALHRTRRGRRLNSRRSTNQRCELLLTRFLLAHRAGLSGLQR